MSTKAQSSLSRRDDATKFVSLFAEVALDGFVSEKVARTISCSYIDLKYSLALVHQCDCYNRP